jgi:hypothetical protein
MAGAGATAGPVAAVEGAWTTGGTTAGVMAGVGVATAGGTVPAAAAGTAGAAGVNWSAAAGVTGAACGVNGAARGVTVAAGVTAAAGGATGATGAVTGAKGVTGAAGTVGVAGARSPPWSRDLRTQAGVNTRNSTTVHHCIVLARAALGSVREELGEGVSGCARRASSCPLAPRHAAKRSSGTPDQAPRASPPTTRNPMSVTWLGHSRTRGAQRNRTGRCSDLMSAAGSVRTMSPSKLRGCERQGHVEPFSDRHISRSYEQARMKRTCNGL